MKHFLSSAIGFLVIGVGTTLLFAGCHGTQVDSSTQVQSPMASVENRLDNALASIEARNFDVIIGFSYKNGPIQFREYGATAKDGISPELTQVDINSITKTVTGVMAAKLVEQGKVEFDETLGDIFADVPVDKAKITLHQLLTHSAGFKQAVGYDYDPVDKDEFLSLALKSKLKFSPGERYSYSNTGFGIVAAIIELRSGKTYEEYLFEDILSGLELNDTGYATVYDKKRSIKSNKGQSIDKASWGGSKPYWHLIGNGGLISTAQDMVRFRQAVVDGEIISKEMLDLIQTPHIQEYKDDKTSFYGYGLVVQLLENDNRFYWHDGGNPYFSSQWGHYPEQDVIIFTMGTGESAYKAMHAFEKHLNVFGED